MKEIIVLTVGVYCVQVTIQYRPNVPLNVIMCYFFMGKYPGKKKDALLVREYDITFMLYTNIVDDCSYLDRIR